MAANITGSIVFIDDVTAEISSTIDYQVFRFNLSGQVQHKATKICRMHHRTDGQTQKDRLTNS